MDIKLELVIIPVSDVDASRDFYADKCGFTVDHDHRVSDQMRFVQVTPPGSACSVSFGQGVTEAVPGTTSGLQVVVSDIEAAQTFFTDRGLDIGEIDVLPWGRFLYFADPDGNKWSVQEVVRPS